ncbi:hypothetical protein NDU88_004630 [Pleurodeles waltl]|uniref:Uncharacterized protein n=1 Tax=Pleurodeles waltl TaxID=8319 RepID=A0AAV7RG80_PLEWA|nr:hypothetical protein NDU88_004630 [Pleurodeles waltl]
MKSPRPDAQFRAQCEMRPKKGAAASPAAKKMNCVPNHVLSRLPARARQSAVQQVTVCVTRTTDTSNFAPIAMVWMTSLLAASGTQLLSSFLLWSYHN